MPVLDLIGREIEYHDIVGVDSDTLEAHNDGIVVVMLMRFHFSVMVLLLVLFRCFHDEEVAISNIKFVLPLDQEAALMWVLLVDSKEMVSKLSLPLVSEDKEALTVRSDGLNAGDSSLLINIEFLVAFGFGQINIQGIILGAEDELVLSFVENGILWSFIKLCGILVNCFDLFGFIIVVKFEDLFFREEKKSIRVILVKLKLHTCVFELPVSQFFNLKFSGAVHLENGDFEYLKLILDQLPSNGNTDLFLVRGNGLIEDLDAFIFIWNLPLLLDDSKIFVVINDNASFISHHISINRGKIFS